MLSFSSSSIFIRSIQFPSMDSTGAEPTTVLHVVAMPFPCQGHINALMSLCKLLSSRKHNLLITFVVTEEWLRCIGSEPKPDNIRFASIPTVIERAKAVDFCGFNEVVKTKMEAPFEQLLDRLEPPVARIIADFELQWSFGVGIRRNIPLASLWTMSAAFFSSLHHYHVFAQAQPQLLPLHLIGLRTSTSIACCAIIFMLTYLCLFLIKLLLMLN